MQDIFRQDPSLEFTTLELLGRGSYGEVHKGISISTKDVVAIKTIQIDPQSDELAQMNSIINEISILKECHHPNIVQYFKSFIFQDMLYIVMEYCACSVRDLILMLQAPFAESEIAIITRDSMQGLAYLHANGKLHRDVKGANILISPDGKVKLTDFGVSAKLDSTVGKRNTFTGSPFWMAVEVASGKEYDGKCDVWSMGITCIEMAEQVPCHSNVHPMRVLFKIVREPAPKLQQPTQWSAKFQDFLVQCLVKDCNKRPTSQDLVNHPFLQSAGNTSQLQELMERARSNKRESIQTQTTASTEQLLPSYDGGGTVRVVSSQNTIQRQDLGTVRFHDTAKTDQPANPFLTVKTPKSRMSESNSLQQLYSKTIQLPFIKQYDLDSLVKPSTPAMLTDIYKSMNGQDPVTLTAYQGNLLRMKSQDQGLDTILRTMFKI